MRAFSVLAASTAIAAATAFAPTAASATTTPAAAAAGSCSLSFPSRVSIGAPYTEVTGRLGSDCAAANIEYADWGLIHPSQGPVNFLFFEPSVSGTTEIAEFYDFDPLGPQQWRGEGASTAGGDAVSQNTVNTDVRVASWASLTGTRSGSTVRLTASVARYSGTYERYIAWTNKVGAIQVKPAGSNTWSHFGYVQSNAYGKAYFTGSIPSTTQVRVIFPNETYIWGVWTPGRTI